MKLLIIRFSSIGDIVLTTPVIRCVKNQLPGVELHFIVKPQFRTVVANNPYIDKIHVLQGDHGKMVEALKAEKFDYIIDLHHNIRTLRLKRALKVPAFSFNKLNLRKLVFTKLKWNVMPRELHIIDRYLQTVEPFGVHNDGHGMDYFISPGEEVPIEDIPTSHHAGYIGIVIGASFYTKKLPVYKLQEICAAINHPIILLGGPEDRAEGEEVQKIDPVKVYNACGKFSLNESADLVRKARLVIAHDTGLMHIAAALKKQVIAVWGSTTPSFGMYPYYGANFLSRQAVPPHDDIQVHKLWCRPCTKIGKHKCPQGHFKCMKNISVEELVKHVNTRLGRGV
ncbi:MAG TPA: glycosyltransferase family 9 protein [Chitinophagaceae bacterium]|jgi:heptosyltransferase-2|nr:glycosyltransferase family 9 protein [Chitinophagaceae bacterium]